MVYPKALLYSIATSPTISHVGSVKCENDPAKKRVVVGRNNYALRALEGTRTVADAIRGEKDVIKYQLIAHINNYLQGNVPAILHGPSSENKSIGQRFKSKERQVGANLFMRMQGGPVFISTSFH